MSDSNFDNALNDCLERLAAGETVAECLARHPQHVDELAPLLRMDTQRCDCRKVPSRAPPVVPGHGSLAECPVRQQA